MKFGKLLRVSSEELDEVEHVAARYKEAKKLLHNCDPGDSQSEADCAFADCVLGHLRSFNAKFEEKEDGLKANYSAMQREVRLFEGPGIFPVHSSLHSYTGDCLCLLTQLVPCALAATAWQQGQALPESAHVSNLLKLLPGQACSLVSVGPAPTDHAIVN